MKDCPLCKQPGQKVPKQTVVSLVKDHAPSENHYWLCLNPSCPGVYFGTGGEIWRQGQVKVPVAFKEGARSKYVCYCSRVTEQDIINVVLTRQAVTLSEAIALTGAMKNGDCVNSNPAGICCSTAFKEAFSRAQEMLKH